MPDWLPPVPSRPADSCRAFSEASMLWTPMNTSINPPMTMLVHHELSCPLNWIRLWISAVMSTPKSPPIR